MFVSKLRMVVFASLGFVFSVCQTGCAPATTQPIRFQSRPLAREQIDALLESVKQLGFYPTVVAPGLIVTRWEDTGLPGLPIRDAKTKYVRHFVFRMEKRAFGYEVSVLSESKRCVPQTVRFTETEVDGECIASPNLPEPLLKDMHRVADRLEQMLAVP
jgi:hypothetical protein